MTRSSEGERQYVAHQSWSGHKGLGSAAVHGLVSMDLLPSLVAQGKTTLGRGEGQIHHIHSPPSHETDNIHVHCDM